MKKFIKNLKTNIPEFVEEYGPFAVIALIMEGILLLIFGISLVVLFGSWWFSLIGKLMP